MKPASLIDLCCPICGKALQVAVRRAEGDQIVEGLLHCTGCSARYPIQNGIPHLLSTSTLEASKVQEVHGWVNLWEQRGMYRYPSLENSYRLPYLGGVWQDVARMFDLAVREMNLQRGQVVLDLGAGQGWAARRFAELGCRVYAVDLVADEWYGLGRSWALMEYAGVSFEPVLADGETLPFFPERFDLIFSCGALHHFENPVRALREARRVLKPGGALIAAAEPSISVFAREKELRASLEETDLGIVERRPKVVQWWWAIRQAGFKNICIDTFETYRASSSQSWDWITTIVEDLCRRTGAPLGLTKYLVRGLVTLIPHRWAGQFVLWLRGGPLLLRAVKNS
jgi:ubiquinone/menaquinone biosynthesis C-methylase UbiE/uncharacterized protein YbaR (Trm112 family)